MSASTGKRRRRQARLDKRYRAAVKGSLIEKKGGRK